MHVALDQHFLVSEEVNDLIIKTIAIKRQEAVVEIGPGKGATTKHLPRARKVILIEKDPSFIQSLKRQFPGYEVICADALDELPRHKFDKLVCNTPFQIIEPLANMLFISDFKAAALIVPAGYYKLLQDKKTKHALYASAFLAVKKVADINRSCFSPVPRTDCVLLKITKKKAKSPYKDIYSYRALKPRNYIISILRNRHSLTNRKAKAAADKLGTLPDMKISQLSYQQVVSLAAVTRKAIETIK